MRDEGADLLVLLGDFDYEDDPSAWDEQITEVLGGDFPVLAVVGNHDVGSWEVYQHLLLERLSRTPEVKCEGDFGVNAGCRFRGLFVVLSGAGTLGKDHERFISEALAADPSVWSICAWHKNQKATQVGLKEDEVGWGPYEACRRGGAIITNGHEHSYERTKTLRSIKQQIVDPAWTKPNELRVGGGSTFVAVSGLGGREVRPQARCYPARPPYGCSFEWASIYTATQGATFGALFIEFNVKSDYRKAHGYFKNVDGVVIDDFSVVREAP